MKSAFLAAILLLTGPAFGADTFVRHPKTLPVGANPSAIVAADLNGDGWPEIITCDIGNLSSPREERPANDELSLLVGQGNLAFTPQPPMRAGFAPYAVVVANIDALKAPDLVVGSFHAVRKQSITLFRNIGDNLFEPIYFSVPNSPNDELPYTKQLDADNQPVFTKPGITSLIVADFNHDGYRDIVATGWSSDVLVFLRGSDTGYFGEQKFIPSPGGPRDIACADFDQDGQLDLATTQYSSHQVALWKGDGAGAFSEQSRFSSRGNLPHKIRIADINGDGRPDLIVSHCSADDNIVIFYGNGGFDFSMSQELVLGKNHSVLESEIRDIVVEDLNGDKRVDIAAACSTSKMVAAFINDSTSPAAPLQFHQEVYTFSDARPRALCTGDFDKNGKTDLAVALWDANAVALLLGKPSK